MLVQVQVTLTVELSEPPGFNGDESDLCADLGNALRPAALLDDYPNARVMGSGTTVGVID